MEPILLTEQQAAQVLTVKVKTLQAWRVRGGGPKFIKLGRCVRYSRDSLLEFLAECTMAHT
jgi:excisionase family DNA binding protein